MTSPSSRQIAQSVDYSFGNLKVSVRGSVQANSTHELHTMEYLDASRLGASARSAPLLQRKELPRFCVNEIGIDFLAVELIPTLGHSECIFYSATTLLDM